MAYEYEDILLDYASDSKTYEEYKGISQELQEVYRKAKAFDELLRHANDEYKAPETKVELIIETIQYYMEDEQND
ncbi:hypothetical protein QI085_10820 [Staphylococcus saprophyticus]|nr:hypothetical protein [Staphylococcus saprophyticus]